MPPRKRREPAFISAPRDPGWRDLSAPNPEKATKLRRFDGQDVPQQAGPRCWCGGEIYNGHHCENGHLQERS